MSAIESVPSTPALVIDFPTVRRNVERLAGYAKQHKLGVRPHTKTHKSLRMARLQLEHGAIGLTAAKAGEAEVMAAASDDLLLAYPAVDPNRCERVAKLAREKSVRVALDTTHAAETLASAAASAGSRLGILVDLDVGLHRTGVQSPAAALALAQAIDRMPSLHVDGLFFYPGQVWMKPDVQREQLDPIAALLAETIELWKRSGIEARVVSGGSTPSAYQSHLIPQQTEIRPGTYLYNDMNTLVGGFCTLDECAARLVCTVVSDAVPGKVVIDAGSKTLSSDRNVTGLNAGFGYVVEYPQARVVRLTEEHGEVDVSACERKPKVGERVRVIPNHICPCVNLQDVAWVREEDGTLTKLTIDARGKLS